MDHLPLPRKRSSGSAITSNENLYSPETGSERKIKK